VKTDPPRNTQNQVHGFAGASEQPEPVFLDLGRMYMGLFPLAMTDHGRTDRVRLEAAGGYRVVSFLNYEGGPREFEAEELRRTFSGFFAHVSGPEECGSFAEFRRNWGLDLVEDWWMANNRRTRVVFRGVELLLNWSTPTDTVRSATINGREPSRARFQATGLDASCFPILSGAYRPMRTLLPLDDLEVAWHPELKWQIGVRRKAAHR